MLVKPLIGRSEHAAFMPIDPLYLATFWEEERIAFAPENNHVGARTVAMGLFVTSRRKLRDV